MKSKSKNKTYETFDIEAYTTPKYRDTKEKTWTPKELIEACATDRVYEVCAMIYTHKEEVRTCLGIDDNDRKEFLLNMPGGTYVVWNGSRYDNHGIIHLLAKYGIPYETPLYIQKNTMLCFEFTNALGEQVIFKDYVKIFATSLDKLLSELVPDMPKLKGYSSERGETEPEGGGYDYSKVREVPEDFSDYDLEYIKADVVGLKKAVKILNREMINLGVRPHHIFTAGGLAVSIMRKKLEERFYNIEHTFNKDTGIVDYDFVSGGMVLPNPEHLYKVVKNVGHYDVVSFYPYTMTLDLPLGAVVETATVTVDEFYKQLEADTNHLYFVKTQCKGLYKGLASPVLRKSPTGVNEMCFSWGEDEEVCITDPILRNPRLQLYAGQVTYSKFLKGRYLKPIVEEIVKKKSEAKSSGNTAQALMFKIIVNSMYGKFIQKPVDSEYYFIPNKGVHKNDLEEAGDLKWHVYLPAGTIITAYARNLLTNVINELGSDFYYCDTDSIFYNENERARAIIENSAFTIGEELGNLSEEDYTLYSEACFLGRKCYLAVGQEGVMSKKGKKVKNVKKSTIAGIRNFKYDTVQEGRDRLLRGDLTVTLTGVQVPQGIILKDVKKGKHFGAKQIE